MWKKYYQNKIRDVNMISQKLNKLAYIHFSSEKHAKANCVVTTTIWRNQLMFMKKGDDNQYTRGYGNIIVVGYPPDKVL